MIALAHIRIDDALWSSGCFRLLLYGTVAGFAVMINDGSFARLLELKTS